MPKLVIANSPPEMPVALSLQERGLGVLLVATHNGEEQMLLRVSNDGSIHMYKMNCEKAKAMGWMLDDRNQVVVKNS